ncbi:MAG: XisI protein [Chloroflexaceae bacterium]|jgi:hypothetical protein|nr:XisI protein [Chloroflexaceae bacterium]
MDARTYPTRIKHILTELAHYQPSHGEITPMVAFDDDHGQYLLLHIGWDGVRRVRSLIAHVRFSDDKIWIEHDGTPPPGIAVALVEAGVPKDDIVLAFHHPSVRPLTEFAVA